MRRAVMRVVAIAVSVCAGVALGALVFRPVSPQGLEEAPGVVEVPVTQRVVDDQRSVQLALTLGPSTSLKTPATGLITSANCRAGESISSGDQVMTLGDQRLYALATSMPLWRDLTLGDRGEDVAALQTELERLGYGVFPDGEVGPRTLRATAELLGMSDPATIRAYTTISRTSFVWLPTSSVVPTSCEAVVGDYLDEHDEIAVLGRSLEQARVADMPADLLPGQRLLSIDGQTISVDEAGVASDPDQLSALQMTPSYQKWLSALSEEPASTLEASLVLAEPATVSSVSPSVIYEVDGTSACVLDKGTPRPVTIVSSELGQTFLIFPDGQAAPDLLPTPPKDAPSCK